MIDHYPGNDKRGSMSPFRCTCLTVFVVVLLAGRASSEASAIGYERTGDGLVVDVDGGRLRLAVCSDRAVRVLFTRDGSMPAPSLVVVRPCEGFQDFALRETAASLSLATSRVEARVNRQTGAVSFHDADGWSVLAETAGGRSLVGAEVLGQKTYHAEQRFDRVIEVPSARSFASMGPRSRVRSGTLASQGIGPTTHSSVSIACAIA